MYKDPEEKIANIVINRLKTGDCCCIAMMRGLGQRYVFDHVLEKLKIFETGKKIIDIYIKDRNELEHFTEELHKNHEPCICLIRIFFEGDYFDLLEKLNNLRIDQFNDFVCCIIAGPENIYSAYKAKLEIITTFLYIVKPWNKEDFLQILSIYEEENQLILPDNIKEQITFLSGGHGGLLKVLFYEYFENNNYDFTIGNVLQNEGVRTWIYYILKSIPFDIEEFFSKDASKEQIIFAEKFGFIQNDKIFSPLLEVYINQNFPTPAEKTDIQDKTILFAKQEREVFEYLLKNEGNLVSRSDIGRIMWGEKALERHSDWALDHVIYRVRGRIRDANLPYQIITKKKLGFMLKQS